MQGYSKPASKVPEGPSKQPSRSTVLPQSSPSPALSLGSHPEERSNSDSSGHSDYEPPSEEEDVHNLDYDYQPRSNGDSSDSDEDNCLG